MARATTERAAPAPVAAAKRGAPTGRRKRWGLIALGVVVAAAVILLGYIVYGTHVLAVRTITVRGATIVSISDVTAAAQVPLGTPLARVDVGAVKRRVEALPRVASAQVRRGWPHDLVIVVHEYTPAAVTLIGGQWQLVDPSGVAFMPAGHTTTLPQVQGSSDAARAACIVVARSLPTSVSRYVTMVRATRPDQVELVLTPSGFVKWGDTSQPKAKAQVLVPLLNLPAKIYDVSVPSAPTVTR